MHLAYTRTSEPESQSGKQNRRAARRYPVKTPLRYRIAGGAPEAAWKSGSTVDMSSTGILVETSEPLPPSLSFEISIDWLGLYHGRPVMRLMLIATVVRTDDRGTALSITRHEFRDIHPPAIRTGRTPRDLAVA
jgi:hypothetical protein